MVTGLDWRLDSNVLASSSEDASVKLWDMFTGNQIKSWNAHGGGTTSVRFAKDGRLVTTGRDRVAKLWAQDGKELKKFGGFADLALQAAVGHDDADRHRRLLRRPGPPLQRRRRPPSSATSAPTR